MKYITTPIEEFKGIGLNPVEKMILSIYKYFTEQGKGKNKCCSMTNESISEELEISLATVVRTKKKLKEMGIIRTDGGIKVYYLGVEKVKMTHLVSQNDFVESQIDSGVSQNDFEVSQNDFVESQIDTHNKEIKKIKENKDNKEEMTNIDLVLDRLPEEYKTKERIEYIKEELSEKINNTSIKDNSILEMLVVRVKSEVIKKYPFTYTSKKQDDKIDYIDLFC